MFGRSKSLRSAPRGSPNFTAMAVVAVLAAGLLGPMLASRKEIPSTEAAAPLVDPSRILVGLPSDAVEANAVFRARVRTWFPPLMPEETLKATLAGQGFVSDGWFGAKRMTFRRGEGNKYYRGCSFAASVTWETDEQARVSTIDGRLLGSLDCF